MPPGSWRSQLNSSKCQSPGEGCQTPEGSLNATAVDAPRRGATANLQSDMRSDEGAQTTGKGRHPMIGLLITIILIIIVLRLLF